MSRSDKFQGFSYNLKNRSDDAICIPLRYSKWLPMRSFNQPIWLLWGCYIFFGFWRLITLYFASMCKVILQIMNISSEKRTEVKRVLGWNWVLYIASICKILHFKKYGSLKWDNVFGKAYFLISATRLYTPLGPSIGWSAGNIIFPNFFGYLWTNCSCSNDLNYIHCPPTRDWGSFVSSLVPWKKPL